MTKFPSSPAPAWLRSWLPGARRASATPLFAAAMAAHGHPAVDPDPATRPKPNSAADLAGCRVLVVEDNLLLASDIAALLKEAGAKVIGPAATVGDALALVEDEPDVALLDVCLGDDLSFPVAKALVRRGTPFIFCTGSAGDLLERHGAHAICTKPVTGSAMLKALADALQSRIAPAG